MMVVMVAVVVTSSDCASNIHWTIDFDPVIVRVSRKRLIAPNQFPVTCFLQQQNENDKMELNKSNMAIFKQCRLKIPNAFNNNVSKEDKRRTNQKQFI